MTVVNTEATGWNIRRMCMEREMSPKDLVEALDYAVTAAAVYKWMSGGALPTVDNLLLLGDVFGCTMDEIVIKKII